MVKHYRPSGKKKEGNAARYVTRSQAVKNLQVSLQVFRRLCIYKGVFPREPKKKLKGKHHSYYHVKDIAFIHHDPLVDKLREIRSYRKKITKAKAKANTELAKILLTRQPTYKLDHVIRDRYPKFIDALRDLDDCLTLVHLFAVLPVFDRVKTEVKQVHNCRRLSHEWQAYISRTHKLRKVFVSVKGIYYQAEVEGQKITWLTPHALQQVLTDDVDFGVMLTFLEFYESLLAFVNFKLYHSINIKYPPILDPKLEAMAADLYALSRYFDASSRASSMEPHRAGLPILEQDGTQLETKEHNESDLRLAQLQHQLPSNEPGALMHLVGDIGVDTDNDDDEDTRECKKLFKNMKFFFSREVPRESLLFVIPSFGGVVSWDGDGAPFPEADKSITHQIVDRPTQGHKYLSREYIQPQWVFDCVNARVILPTEAYAVGRVPPPHLSPFVDHEAEGYVPDYAETIKRYQAAARKEVLPMPDVGKEGMDDPQNLLIQGVITRSEAIEATERINKMNALEKQYHDEMKKELKGDELKKEVEGVGDISLLSLDTTKQENSSGEPAEETAQSVLEQSAKDAENMSTLVMPRRKKGLLDAMKIGEDRKKARINTLKERKKKIENPNKS